MLFSCLLILSTLFGSTARNLPTTTTTTFLEIWMMFAVLLTFSETVLQTIFGYYKEKEKQSKIIDNSSGISTIKPLTIPLSSVTNVTPNITSKFNQNLSNSKSYSSHVNVYFGRFLFPLIALLFTIIYSGFAIFYYYADRDFEHQETC